MENKNAKFKIKKIKEKNQMQKMTYEEQCGLFEKFIIENNCKIKKEEPANGGK